MAETYDSTAAFIEDLHAHYDPDTAGRQRYISGSFLPLLTSAMEETRATWRQAYGQEMPDLIAQRGYTLPLHQEATAWHLAAQVDSSAIERLSEMGVWPTNNDPYELKVLDSSALIKRNVFTRIMDFGSIRPNLTLATSLDRPPHVGIKRADASCMAAIFGKNALHIFGPVVTGGYSAASAHQHIPQEKLPPRARHQLNDLLHLLSTDYVANRAGQTVRLISTVGADFNEIEARVLQNIRRRRPDARFILNAVIGSSFAPTANHAVVVHEATDDYVTVDDPKIGEVKMRQEVFWRRWITTNMHAVVTVLFPNLKTKSVG